MSAMRRFCAEVVAWLVVVGSIIGYEATREIDLDHHLRKRRKVSPDDAQQSGQNELESDNKATEIAEGNNQHNTRREKQ